MKKLDDLTIEFMNAYNNTLLRALKQDKIDFQCLSEIDFICDMCPWSFNDEKQATCAFTEKNEYDENSSIVEKTFEEWQLWFHDVTDLTDIRTREQVKSKTPLMFYTFDDKLAKVSNEFRHMTSEHVKPINLVELRKVIKTMNNDKATTNNDKVTTSVSDSTSTSTSAHNNFDDVLTKCIDDARKNIKYIVTVKYGRASKKYENVDAIEMRKLVNDFMTAYHTWLGMMTYSSIEELNEELAAGTYAESYECSVVNAKTLRNILHVSCDISNFGIGKFYNYNFNKAD